MNTYTQYQTCIEACLRCAAICNYCASSCTKEENVKMMAHCIQLDMEGAALCFAADQLMSPGSKKAKEVCAICANVCEECAEECAKHDTDHCRKCAESCRKCAEECRAMANH